MTTQAFAKPTIPAVEYPTRWSREPALLADPAGVVMGCAGRAPRHRRGLAPAGHSLGG